jgi:threonine/homoserine/homoserine lactone efflux protein
VPDALTLGLFALAATALILVPGPNLVYIVTRSLTQGTRAGVMSALGVETATLVFVLATAFGVAGLVSRSDHLLSAIQVLGAAYLVYLGVQTLRHPPSLAMPGQAPPPTVMKVYREGVVVNLLNPKVLIFFVSFLPQFVDPGAASSPAAQMLVLGAVFLFVALTLDLGYAAVGGAMASRLLNAGLARRWMRWPVATVYLSLATYTVGSVA